MSGCCGPSSISQCFHGQQWSYFQPVVVGFGTSPPVRTECVLMSKIRHKLMYSGVPKPRIFRDATKPSQEDQLLTAHLLFWILLRRVSRKPRFLFSFSLLLLPASSQMRLFCSYVCGAEILRGIEALLHNQDVIRGGPGNWHRQFGLELCAGSMLCIHPTSQGQSPSSTASLKFHHKLTSSRQCKVL